MISMHSERWKSEKIVSSTRLIWLTINYKHHLNCDFSQLSRKQPLRFFSIYKKLTTCFQLFRTSLAINGFLKTRHVGFTSCLAMSRYAVRILLSLTRTDNWLRRLISSTRQCHQHIYRDDKTTQFGRIRLNDIARHINLHIYLLTLH